MATGHSSGSGVDAEGGRCGRWSWPAEGTGGRGVGDDVGRSGSLQGGMRDTGVAVY
jgi:hypothetical protein